jgi:hypothetical protein
MVISRLSTIAALGHDWVSEITITDTEGSVSREELRFYQ